MMFADLGSKKAKKQDTEIENTVNELLADGQAIIKELGPKLKNKHPDVVSLSNFYSIDTNCYVFDDHLFDYGSMAFLRVLLHADQEHGLPVQAYAGQVPDLVEGRGIGFDLFSKQKNILLKGHVRTLGSIEKLSARRKHMLSIFPINLPRDNLEMGPGILWIISIFLELGKIAIDPKPLLEDLRNLRLFQISPP